MENLSIEQFRHKILLRLLFRKARFNKEMSHQELLFSTMIIANKILREENIENVSARQRGQRLFLFYRPTHKIICEIGLDGYNILLINLKGVIPNYFKLQEIIRK